MAEQVERKNLKVRRRVLGEEHPDTLESLNNLANVLLDQEKPDEAEPYLLEVVEKSGRVWGEDSPATIKIHVDQQPAVTSGQPIERPA